MKAIKNKIQAKITITYFLFSIIILSVLGLIINYEIESIVINNVEQNLLNEINLLEYYVTDTKITDQYELWIHLKAHALKSDIRITLIDAKGIVKLDTDKEFDEIREMENHLSRPEIRSADINGTGKDVRLSNSTKQEYLYIAQKLERTNLVSDIKFIRASMSLVKIKAMLMDVRWKIVYAALFVLALVFVLSVLISKRMTKPIIRIIADLGEISKGNFGKTINVKSEDEIKTLAESINNLVLKIRNDINELETLSKFRSEFLANVSHEIRTPLFSIQAYLETLLSGGLDDPEINKSYLQKSLNNVERLNILLNDLVEISRIESGELKLSFRYFEIDKLIGSVFDNLSVAIEQKKINIDVECEPALKVYGDKEKLFTLFSNLIDNAVKYNPETTSIKIKCRKEQSVVKVEVADNGIGIEPKHLPRIFERFYRIDKDRSREKGGTGLGLAIAKHIVEAHESKIEVESEIGRGTTFRFTLRA